MRSRSRSGGGWSADGEPGFTLVEIVVVLAILAILASVAVISVAKLHQNAETTVATATLHMLRDAIAGTVEAPGYLADMQRVPGFRSVGLRLHDLLSPSSYPAFSTFDPQGARGWRGPYVRNTLPVRNTNAERCGLFPAADERRWPGDTTFSGRGFHRSDTTSDYGVTGDQAIADPWGNPVVVQIPPPEAMALSSDDDKRFHYARLVSAGADGALQTPRDRLAGLQADGTCALRGDDLVLFLNRPDVYEQEEH